MEITQGPGGILVKRPDGKWELHAEVIVIFESEEEARSADAKLEATMKQTLLQAKPPAAGS